MSYLAVSLGGLPQVGTTTNSTGGGGTLGTVASIVGAVYATDATAIAGNFNQLATLGIVVT